MELYDAVNSICRVTGVNYILHRSMREQSVKVYKKFVYDLYKVSDTKELVLHKEFTLKAPSNEFEKIWESLDKDYLSMLLKFVFYGNE